MAAAITSGRVELLNDLRTAITDWALEQDRREGFGARYLHQAMEPAEQRREAIEVLVDAATANLLTDVLPEDTLVTLGGRFDVLFGGPGFTTESE